MRLHEKRNHKTVKPAHLKIGIIYMVPVASHLITKSLARNH